MRINRVASTTGGGVQELKLAHATAIISIPLNAVASGGRDDNGFFSPTWIPLLAEKWQGEAIVLADQIVGQRTAQRRRVNSTFKMPDGASRVMDLALDDLWRRLRQKYHQQKMKDAAGTMTNMAVTKLFFTSWESAREKKV